MPDFRNRLSPVESALVVMVSEADTLVKPFRDRHDPSAAQGMLAHVTVLYPFLAPKDIGPAVLEELRHCIAEFNAFQFSLTTLQRFRGVLYLAPKPDKPFRALTEAIWARYPERPPYGGQYVDIVPHLSIAQLTDEKQLDEIADDSRHASDGKLPIRATAQEITLMDNRSGRWQIHTTFQLGA